MLAVGGMAAAMWAEEIVDLLPGTPFDRWGIRPREVRGLIGIVLAPFLHSGFAHLIANTVPFLVLGAIICLGGAARFAEVVVVVGGTSGLGVWLFGAAHTVHIGASGLVFGFLTYLISRGLFAKKVLWMMGGLVVMFFYGGILWGLLPREGVSFTGHLFGAAGGVLAAYAMHAVDDEPATQ